MKINVAQIEIQMDQLRKAIDSELDKYDSHEERIEYLLRGIMLGITTIQLLITE